MRPDLEMLYRLAKAPVAFIDESYETRGDSTFYILGAVLVHPERLNLVRQNLARLNSGHPIHASDLYSSKNLELLNQAIELVADDHDNADLVISSPLIKGDSNGEASRQACLRTALIEIQKEFATELFVLDSRRLKDADDADRRTVSDLRKLSKVSRTTAIRHVWPTEEILLSLPDVVAWSYRQILTKNDTRWFQPLEPSVRVSGPSPS